MMSWKSDSKERFGVIAQYVFGFLLGNKMVKKRLKYNKVCKMFATFDHNKHYMQHTRYTGSLSIYLCLNMKMFSSED